ncbi:MAG: hypothetical protein U5J62_05605 [Desulfurivibrio sp.]|nr:hypothetical protein [Desulfurivibrio sp.]
MTKKEYATDSELITTSRNIWDQATKAIVILGNHSGSAPPYLQANGKVFTISGLPRKAIYGRPCHQIFHGSDHPCEVFLPGNY